MFGAERVNSLLRQRALRGPARTTREALWRRSFLQVEVQVQVPAALEGRYRQHGGWSQPDRFGCAFSSRFLDGVAAALPRDEAALDPEKRCRVLDENGQRCHSTS